MVSGTEAAEIICEAYTPGKVLNHSGLSLRCRNYGVHEVWTVVDDTERRVDIINPRAYNSARDLLEHLDELADNISLKDYDLPTKLG